MGSGTRAFQQVIEKTQLNMKWIQNNHRIIEQWLDKHLQLKESTVDDVRLPRSVSPYLYELEIFPDIYHTDPADFKFVGHVKIWIHTFEATSNITLHSNKLTIDESTIFIGTNESIISTTVQSTSEDTDRQFFIIQLKGLLDADRDYFVEMNYTGILANDLTGLYYSSYKRGNKTV